MVHKNDNKVFLDRLRKVISSDNLVEDREGLKVYRKDGLADYSGDPLVVAIPNTEAQTSKILKICSEFSVPVVTRGAGTGLSGGATPIKDCLVLSTARMNKVISINEEQRSATVQPGVRNLEISNKVSGLGLFYAPDPSSQIACSIGGNLAENSGGVHCLKYGLTFHNVLRARVLNYRGEVFEVGSEALDSPGLDLLALLIGFGNKHKEQTLED